MCESAFMLLDGVVVEQQGDFRFPSYIKVTSIQFLEDVFKYRATYSASYNTVGSRIAQLVDL